MKTRFLTPLKELLVKPDVSPSGNWNGKDWVLASKLKWTSANCIIHTVPVGFSTDGASIPRMARPLFNPLGGAAFRAAIVHDWIYRGHSDIKYSRKEADGILYDLMLDDNVPRWRANLIYRAVRLGGFPSFHG